MNLQHICFYLLILFSSLITTSKSSKILVLVVFPSTSHWLMFEHVIKELLARDHEVTTVTNYPLSGSYDDYHEYLIHPKFSFESDIPMSTYFEKKTTDAPFLAIQILWFLGLKATEHALNCSKVQELLHETDQRFDLVISEQFYQESFLMFAHKYKTPIVTVGTLSTSDFMDRAMGLLTPWSYVPHFMLEYTDVMNLGERIYNVVLSAYDMLMRKYQYLPSQNELAQNAFKDLKEQGPLPTIEELEKSISVILVNSHNVFSRPRPKLPGLIDIAGLHIRKPQPLPQDIQDFINSHSSKGIIYFSLGSYLRSSAMSVEKLQVFLNVFKKLPYGIIWKWDKESIVGLPNNVMVRKWLPQSDILADPHVKLFMTHGGLFGTQEAIHRARPMVLFPCYGDQHQNSYRLQRASVGRVLSLANLTANELESTILEVATNLTYKKNIDKVSLLFQDNPKDPLEETVYWIEYVIRHRGAKHLRSASRDLPWYQYLLLDILAIVLAIMFIFVFAVKRLVKLFSKSEVKQHFKRE